jgi:hypothetical protein
MLEVRAESRPQAPLARPDDGQEFQPEAVGFSSANLDNCRFYKVSPARPGFRAVLRKLKKLIPFCETNLPVKAAWRRN